MTAHFVRTGDPDRPTRQVVAEERGVGVGLGVLGASRINPASTLIIAVDEMYRRRGIGTALLAWLAGKLDSPRLVSASVSEESPAGIAFAQRQGFEERSRTFPSVRPPPTTTRITRPCSPSMRGWATSGDPA
jgi:GNAT superfamily N-acetyltransferase